MLIIYITNSCLDGFREGDGDLMDKIMCQLLSGIGTDICVRRIIVNSINVPEDRRDGCVISLAEKIGVRQKLLAQFELGKLSTEGSATLIKRLQMEFLRIITSDMETQKILYIGSRFDAVIHPYDDSSLILRGSGSLFTQPFLEELKAHGIKSVICCLEYKFFKRSIKDLEKVQEMFRQQLLLADKVQFLTESDLEDFLSTINYLAINFRNGSPAVLRPVPQLVIASDQEKGELSRIVDLASDIRRLAHPLSPEDSKARAIFIPGIYTVDPLTDADIITSLMPLYRLYMPGSSNATMVTALAIPQTLEDEDAITALSSRSLKVLCFGLIRRDKGIEEAVSLAAEFKRCFEDEHLFRDVPKVIIAGKIIGSVRYFFDEIVRAALRKLTGLAKKEIRDLLGEAISDTLSDYEREKDETFDPDSINETSFVGGQKTLNRFCADILGRITVKTPQLSRYLEIHLNSTEVELKEIALHCKYAIKFDHKGMAHNASSIISCLGFYLPTFTLCGLTTDQCFKADGAYFSAVIMPLESYTNDKGEVKPVKPAIEWVVDLIIREDVESYKTRLRCLRQLHKKMVCLNVKMLLAG